MGKIVFGEHDTPLTVDIADEKRQALAYNMIRHMMVNGAEITVNGKQVPPELDQLWIMSQEDDVTQYTKPHLDPEWFGANKDFFAKAEDPLTLTNLCEGNVFVNVAPITRNYEKANEMFHFMHRGIDENVSIAFSTDKGMKPVVVNGRPENTAITYANENYYLCTERSIPNWETSKASDIMTSVFTGVPKYELLPEDTKNISSGSYDEYYESDRMSGRSCKDRTVYRIRALYNFGDVKAGDLGGYVESENNLSHDGTCWVYDNAAVCYDAVVRDTATVRGEAEIIQSAIISGDANVFGEARISGDACVSERAQVGWEWDGTQDEKGRKNGDRTIITGSAKISDNAQVLGEVIVSGNAKVRDNAKVEGKWPIIPKHKNDYVCCVCDNSIISGNAQVTNSNIKGSAYIYENAVVSGHPMTGKPAIIKSKAEIGGDIEIIGDVTIAGNYSLEKYLNDQMSKDLEDGLAAIDTAGQQLGQ